MPFDPVVNEAGSLHKLFESVLAMNSSVLLRLLEELKESTAVTTDFEFIITTIVD